MDTDWQVQIEEEDKPKTVFQVGTLGLNGFYRMSFGLCKVQATFQCLMEMCMNEINLRDRLVFLEDVIIFSATFGILIERLQAVFLSITRAQPKTEGFIMWVYVIRGHLLGPKSIPGRHQNWSKKTSAIKNWPVPKTVKDVRAFLVLTGYYWRFLKITNTLW